MHIVPHTLNIRLCNFRLLKILSLYHAYVLTDEIRVRAQKRGRS